MQTRFTVLILFASLLAAPATADSVEMPESATSAGTPLVLNGAGVRNRFFVDVYVAGLYLSRRSRDATAIIEADQPMLIRLRVTSGLVTNERMRSSIQSGFERSTGGDTEPIRRQIEVLSSVFADEIDSGDVFDLAWIPGGGLSVAKNGVHRTLVAGDLTFKRAFFGIWLSDRPIQSSLKRDLLGL